MGHRAPFIVSAALAATLGLGLGVGGFAPSASADEAGTAGGSTLAGIIGALAQAGSDAAAGDGVADATDGTAAAGGATDGNAASAGDGATTAAPDPAGNDSPTSTGAASAQVFPAELSDDPFAMQFAFDGTVIQLPCTVADFAQAGFALAPDDAGDVLDDGYTVSTSLYYGDPDDYVSITCTVYNASGAALPLEECMVDSVYFSDFLLEGHTVEIGNGITLGASSQADVEAVYGPAVDPFVDGDYVSFDCEKDGDHRTYLEFTFSKDSLANLAIDTPAEYEGITYAPAAAGGEETAGDGTGAATDSGTKTPADKTGDSGAQDEEPAGDTGSDASAASGAGIGGILANLGTRGNTGNAAGATDGEADGTGAGSTATDGASAADTAGTTAPKADAAQLSDDPFGFQVAIDGTVVQLPCPVSDLAALGFALEEDKAGDLLEDGYQTSATLFYGDPDDYVYVNATVCNVSGSAQTLENCTVSSLSFHGSNLEDHTVEIAGGLEIGVSTVDEALTVFGEPSFDWTSDDGTSRSFDFNPSEDNYWDTVSLWFRDGVLDEISLSTTAAAE